jgi:hypothetical protein
MKEQKKSRGYVTHKDSFTGKIYKGKVKVEEDDDFGRDDSPSTPLPETIRINPCPYKFDNLKIAEKLIKPFKKLELDYAVNVEISLAITPKIPIEEHIHEVFYDIDVSKLPSDTDLSENEFEFGFLFCGLTYTVKPQINITLKNKEVIDDKKTLTFIKKIADEAVNENLELEEFGEREKNEQKLENHINLFEKISDYFQEHLGEALKRTVERLEIESHLLNDRTDERESGIAIMLVEEESELRRRLPIVKGRVPTKQRKDYKPLKSKFITDCEKILTELDSKKTRLNKNQLAKKMFRGDNPLLLLNRKLKDFELTFDEILQKYIEQKSS